MFYVTLKSEESNQGLAIEGPGSLEARSPHDFLLKFRRFLDDFDNLKYIEHIKFKPPQTASEEEQARWSKYVKAGALALKSFVESLGDPGDSLLGLTHICANLETILEKPSSDLIQVSRPFDAVVISAGPSLDSEWDHLREIQGRALLVACDAVLRSCLERGITPHLVCCTERRSLTLPFFKGLPRDLKTIMVGQGTLTPTVFHIYPGPQTVSFKLQSHFQWLGLNRKLHWVAGSVAHLCYQMAASLGARSIALVGQDLAFHPDSLQTHGTVSAYPEWSQGKSAQALAEETEIQYVPGNLRDVVPTKMLWTSFAQQFEELIKGSQVPTFNTSVLGRKLEQAPFMKFSEWCERLEEREIKVSVPSENPHRQEELKILQERLPLALKQLKVLESDLSQPKLLRHIYDTLPENLTFLELLMEICIRDYIHTEGQLWLNPEREFELKQNFFEGIKPWVKAVRQVIESIKNLNAAERRVEN